MFSVKHNRNGFAAFGKITAVPCPFVMNGKKQRQIPTIALGAKSDDELNRGLEKVATRANLEEVTRLLAQETHR